MAGMFYSLQEVIEKLNKTEEQIKEIVKQGRLREFRDGPNLLFKVDEVEALMSGTDITPSQEVPANAEQVSDDEISFAPETTAQPPADSQLTELTEADTIVPSEKVNVPPETPTDYIDVDEAMDETMAISEETSLTPAEETSLTSSEETVSALADETLSALPSEPSLEEIEEDVSLDSFGSGSGLLDLSLQADDTSLGGILDEIYTPEGEEDQAVGAAGLELGVDADTEQMLEEAAQPVLESPMMAKAYLESAPDMASNVFGLMLIVPLLAVVYTAIVVVAAFRAVTPSILTTVQELIWYIAGGVAVVVLLMMLVPVVFAGGEKTTKKAKPKKVKKAKAEKQKKPKKPKKDKKKDKKAKR